MQRVLPPARGQRAGAGRITRVTNSSREATPREQTPKEENPKGKNSKGKNPKEENNAVSLQRIIPGI